MMDLDVRLINYRKADATPDWMKLFRTVSRLISVEMANEDILENFYCLTRNPAAEENTEFGLDDLRDLAPEQFPEQNEDLERWLEEFRSIDADRLEEELYGASKRVWRNVSLRERDRAHGADLQETSGTRMMSAILSMKGARSSQTADSKMERM
ncbi:hypothetical protein F4680DRAFT_417912 [Xylaria scruposa]|nr:hypothetical protein F4680DRAFT_417912 [Xylaria scruposa]